jgi:hypothetical protein
METKTAARTVTQQKLQLRSCWMVMPFLPPWTAAKLVFVQPARFASTRHCTPDERLVNKDAKTFWHAGGRAETGREKLHKWAKQEEEGKNWLDKKIRE